MGCAPQRRTQRLTIRCDLVTQLGDTGARSLSFCVSVNFHCVPNLSAVYERCTERSQLQRMMHGHGVQGHSRGGWGSNGCWFRILESGVEHAGLLCCAVACTELRCHIAGLLVSGCVWLRVMFTFHIVGFQLPMYCSAECSDSLYEGIHTNSAALFPSVA
jgi:hypothetical protein